MLSVTELVIFCEGAMYGGFLVAIAIIDVASSWSWSSCRSMSGKTPFKNSSRQCMFARG